MSGFIGAVVLVPAYPLWLLISCSSKFCPNELSFVCWQYSNDSKFVFDVNFKHLNTRDCIHEDCCRCRLGCQFTSAVTCSSFYAFDSTMISRTHRNKANGVDRKCRPAPNSKIVVVDSEIQHRGSSDANRTFKLGLGLQLALQKPNYSSSDVLCDTTTVTKLFYERGLFFDQTFTVFWPAQFLPLVDYWLGPQAVQYAHK